MSRHDNLFERHKFLTGTVLTLVFSALVLLLAELSVRAARPDINFVGQSAELFQPRRFGESYGHQPNAHGVSWGVDVYTDSLGFRTYSPDIEPPQVDAARGSIVVLGDSVPFGLGIPARDTFPRILERLLGQRIINTAAAGYNVEDYEAVIQHFVLLRHKELNIRKVLLFLTLNDIHGVSASAIHMGLNQTSANQPRHRGLVGWLVALNQELHFNDWLIGHSKLYLLVKGSLYDSSRQWYLADYAAYQDEKRVAVTAEILSALSRKLSVSGLPLTVFLLPYEYQLREQEPSRRKPQNLLIAALQQRGLEPVDLYGSFLDYMRQRRLSSQSLFLFNDHVHLNSLGHKLTAEQVAQTLIIEGR